MKKSGIILTLALSVVALTAQAQESFSGYQVSPEGAWCWFADPRAIHYENADGSINASYLGYIDVHGNIKATQYDFNTCKRNEVLVRSYFQPDDHNNPTFLVLPDERVLIIYSRHTDERAFYYRVSVRPGDITELGEEKCLTTTANTTYPSPFILSDDPEHFYLCWRGIGWHPTIARFTLPDENDDVTTAWGPYQMVQSTGARPYAKYYSNGKDKLYMTYTTGHPDNEQPNWVYFNVININASRGADGKVTANPVLEDVKGNTLKTIADGKFQVSKTDSYKSSYSWTIVESPSNMRDWVWQIVSDRNDNPAIAMVRINGGKDSHDYYYAKWTGEKWRLTPLVNGGGKFHPSNTERCYSGGMAIDPQNPETIYLSVPTDGDHGKIFEIWKYTVDDNGAVTATEQITRNSVKNNVRPYVLPGSEGSPLRLGWMNGDYYYWMVNKNYPAGYPTGIMCDYNYIETISPYADAPVSATDYGMKPVAADGNVSVDIPSGDFTLNLTLSLSHDSYKGTILSSTGLSYALGADDAIPYATVAGKTYRSTNRLYTSDNWAFNSNGTNSDNWPTKLGEFNLTLSYNGSKLTIYRNGVIDQVINATLTDLADMKIGGFDGALGSVTLFDKCLSQDEVKYALHSNALASVSIPEKVVTDIVLPAKIGGESVAWSSDKPEIISASGIFSAPEAETEVNLTAELGGHKRRFKVTAMPRNLALNLLASYDFEASELTEADGARKVADLSGNNRDLTVMGSATVDGALNLTRNSSTGFANNGYAVLPAGVLDGVRSYSVLLSANAVTLAAAPRFYDLGCNSGNSLFFRANTPAAGIKVGGGATTFTESSFRFVTDRTYQLAVTYDAATHITTIYVDGEAVASGTENLNEPYMLLAAGSDARNYIGRTQWWDGQYGADNGDFVGTIDNFRFYNTALTKSEIMAEQGFTEENPDLNVNCDSYLENRDFEGGFVKAQGTGVDADRAVYLPDGWTLEYPQKNNFDMSIVDGTCLYADLFASVAALPDGGQRTYRIRQRWGTSTLGLSQHLDKLPAGYYRLSASAWLSGNGGSANIYASSVMNGKLSTPVVTGSGWQTAAVVFPCNGVETPVVGFEALHTSDSELLSGFDNFTLADITANKSAGDLAALLKSMVVASETLLKGTLPNESARESLKSASDAANSSSAETQPEFYALYTPLRDALKAAQDPSLSGLNAVENADADQPRPLYDITGRLLNSAASASDLRLLAPGLYLFGSEKLLVK